MYYTVASRMSLPEWTRLEVAQLQYMYDNVVKDLEKQAK